MDTSSRGPDGNFSTSRMTAVQACKCLRYESDNRKADSTLIHSSCIGLATFIHQYFGRPLSRFTIRRTLCFCTITLLHASPRRSALSCRSSCACSHGCLVAFRCFSSASSSLARSRLFPLLEALVNHDANAPDTGHRSMPSSRLSSIRSLSTLFAHVLRPSISVSLSTLHLVCPDQDLQQTAPTGRDLCGRSEHTPSMLLSHPNRHRAFIPVASSTSHPVLSYHYLPKFVDNFISHPLGTSHNLDRSSALQVY